MFRWPCVGRLVQLLVFAVQEPKAITHTHTHMELRNDSLVSNTVWPGWAEIVCRCVNAS